MNTALKYTKTNQIHLFQDILYKQQKMGLIQQK